MYVVELQFECFDNTTVSAVDKAINGLMDALRYNGQVLGREFPIVMGDGEFCTCGLPGAGQPTPALPFRLCQSVYESFVGSLFARAENALAWS